MKLLKYIICFLNPFICQIKSYFIVYFLNRQLLGAQVHNKACTMFWTVPGTRQEHHIQYIMHTAEGDNVFFSREGRAEKRNWQLGLAIKLTRLWIWLPWPREKVKMGKKRSRSLLWGMCFFSTELWNAPYYLLPFLNKLAMSYTSLSPDIVGLDLCNHFSQTSATPHPIPSATYLVPTADIWIHKDSARGGKCTFPFKDCLIRWLLEATL